MIKILVFLLMLLTLQSFGAPVKNRKVSNSHYFTCQIEREASDKKHYKKEFHFPFPTDKDETYELKSSQRWNDLKIVFTDRGEVSIEIGERSYGVEVRGVKTLSMGKEPQFSSFKTSVEFKKDSLPISYSVQCGPE